MPSLEAVVHIAQSTLHQVLVTLSERSTCDVTTCTRVDGPTLSLTRIDVLIVIEARIDNVVRHILTILMSRIQWLGDDGLDHIGNLLDFSLQFLIGQGACTSHILNVHVIAVVSQVVHWNQALVLSLEYIIGLSILNSSLPVLPERDVLLEVAVSSADTAHHGIQFLDVRSLQVALESSLVSVHIRLGVERSLFNFQVSKFGDSLVQIEFASIGTLSVVGQREVVEDTPVTVDSRSLLDTEGQFAFLTNSNQHLIIIEA